MNRFEGLTFARQGLQVLVLVVTPFLFTGILFGLFLLFPDLLNVEWLYMGFAVVFLILTIYITLKVYYKSALIPCSIELTAHSIVIVNEGRNLFYPFKQKVIPLDNVKNASCSSDTRLNKAFINITTRHPKTTYAIQYLDERADNPNPEVWQQIEAILGEYNTDERHEKITKTGFFEGWAMLPLMFISGAFIIAFSIAMAVDSEYRNTERVIKFIAFLVIFLGLLSSYLYNKKRNNKPW